MGQRHQLFVVAKVASRYRVLAAIHHQWLFGEWAVRKSLQIVKMFQANAHLLRQDLQVANQMSWQSVKPPRQRSRVERRAMISEERLEERETELAHETLFPMITTCLMTGAAKRSEGYSRVHLLPITNSLKDCDNNDGFSIFDITDPGHPRYCFVLGEDSEPLSNGETDHVLAMSPIAARAYLACYEARDGDEEEAEAEDEDDEEALASNWNANVTNAIIRLETDPFCRELEQNFAPIDAVTLAETWPNEDFQASQALPGATTSDSQKSDAAVSQQSLRSKAMSSVISRALEDEGAELSWLTDAEQLPDFADEALAHLTATPTVITTTAGLNLLCRVLRGRQDADLSMFDQLKPEQLLHLVSELQDSACEVKLTLPCLELMPEHIRQVAHAGNIVELRLGATKGVEMQSLIEATAGAELAAISHPASYKTALVAMNKNPEDLPQLVDSTIQKALRGSPLCQAVWIATNRFAYGPKREPTRLASGAVAWAQHLARTSHANDTLGHFSAIGNFSLPSQHSVVPIPLHDLPVSTLELLPRLYRTFAAEVLVAAPSLTSFADLGFSLAMSLATNDDGQISPLPATLLGSYIAKGRSNGELNPLVKPIVPGEWTMLVCQERDMGKGLIVDSTTVHHCFVTRGEDGKLICRTLEEFMELLPTRDEEQKTAIVASELVARLGSIPTGRFWKGESQIAIGDCDTEEAEQAIKATEMYNRANEEWMQGQGGEMLQYARQSF